MKYLCLICAEKVMEQMPRADADKHFEEYREFTDAIRQSGHYLGCNRLLPPDAASTASTFCTTATSSACADKSVLRSGDSTTAPLNSTSGRSGRSRRSSVG